MSVGFTVLMHAPAGGTVDQWGTTILMFKFMFKLNSHI